jgi:hypothetical protein
MQNKKHRLIFIKKTETTVRQDKEAATVLTHLDLLSEDGRTIINPASISSAFLKRYI